MKLGHYYYLSLMFYIFSDLPFPLLERNPRKFSDKHFCQRNCKVRHQAQNNLSALDTKVTDKQIGKQINLRMQVKNYWASSVRPILNGVIG